MGAAISAEDLLKKLAESGYFQSTSYDPSKFTQLVEYKLNVSQDRALNLLTQSGYASLEYSRDAHPREGQEYWRLKLICKGSEVLGGKAL